MDDYEDFKEDMLPARDSLVFNRKTRGMSIHVDDELLQSATHIRIASFEDLHHVKDLKAAEQRRNLAFEELIETEEKYNETLQLLDQHFRLGLQAHLLLRNIPEILSKNEINIIFMNLPELLKLSDIFLTSFKGVYNSE